jgi:hypothetical protein
MDWRDVPENELDFDPQPGTPEPYVPDPPRHCPFCTYVCYDMRAEVGHMQSKHPDVIDQRLKTAGLAP